MAEPQRSEHELNARLLRFRSRPESEDPQQLAADLLEAERFGDARGVVIASQPPSGPVPQMLVIEGRAWMAEGELTRALDRFLGAVRLAADQAEPYRWLGRTLMLRGDPLRAQRAFEQSLDIEPASVETRDELAQVQAAVERARERLLDDAERLRSVLPPPPGEQLNTADTLRELEQEVQAEGFEAEPTVFEAEEDLDAEAIVLEAEEELELHDLPPQDDSLREEGAAVAHAGEIQDAHFEQLPAGEAHLEAYGARRMVAQGAAEPDDPALAMAPEMATEEAVAVDDDTVAELAEHDLEPLTGAEAALEADAQGPSSVEPMIEVEVEGDPELSGSAGARSPVAAEEDAEEDAEDDGAVTVDLVTAAAHGGTDSARRPRIELPPPPDWFLAAASKPPTAPLVQAVTASAGFDDGASEAPTKDYPIPGSELELMGAGIDDTDVEAFAHEAATADARPSLVPPSQSVIPTMGADTTNVTRSIPVPPPAAVHVAPSQAKGMPSGTWSGRAQPSGLADDGNLDAEAYPQAPYFEQESVVEDEPGEDNQRVSVLPNMMISADEDEGPESVDGELSAGDAAILAALSGGLRRASVIEDEDAKSQTTTSPGHLRAEPLFPELSPNDLSQAQSGSWDMDPDITPVDLTFDKASLGASVELEHGVAATMPKSTISMRFERDEDITVRTRSAFGDVEHGVSGAHEGDVAGLDVENAFVEHEGDGSEGLPEVLEARFADEDSVLASELEREEGDNVADERESDVDAIEAAWMERDAATVPAPMVAIAGVADRHGTHWEDDPAMAEVLMDDMSDDVMDDIAAEAVPGMVEAEVPYSMRGSLPPDGVFDNLRPGESQYPQVRWDGPVAGAFSETGSEPPQQALPSQAPLMETMQGGAPVVAPATGHVRNETVLEYAEARAASMPPSADVGLAPMLPDPQDADVDADFMDELMPVGITAAAGQGQQQAQQELSTMGQLTELDEQQSSATVPDVAPQLPVNVRRLHEDAPAVLSLNPVESAVADRKRPSSSRWLWSAAAVAMLGVGSAYSYYARTRTADGQDGVWALARNTFGGGQRSTASGMRPTEQRGTAAEEPRLEGAPSATAVRLPEMALEAATGKRSEVGAPATAPAATAPSTTAHELATSDGPDSTEAIAEIIPAPYRPAEDGLVGRPVSAQAAGRTAAPSDGESSQQVQTEQASAPAATVDDAPLVTATVSKPSVSAEAMAPGEEAQTIVATVLNRKDLAAAEAMLASLSQAERQSKDVRLAEARLRLQQGREDRALMVLDPLRKKNPDAATLAMVGEALYAKGHVNGSAMQFEAALARNPDEIGALLGRAEVYLRAGNPAQAMPMLERAAGRVASMGAGEGALFRVRRLSLLGHAYLQRSEEGDRERAYAVLSQAVNMPFVPPEAYFWLGESLGGRRTMEAANAYRTYLERDPDGRYVERANRALGPL